MTIFHFVQATPAQLIGIFLAFVWAVGMYCTCCRASLRVATILRCAFMFSLALSYTYAFMSLSLWLDTRLELSPDSSWILSEIVFFGSIMLPLVVFFLHEKRKQLTSKPTKDLPPVT